MEPKKAIEILRKMLESRTLTAEEKEAINAAIGMLSWGSLAQSKMKSQKAKREKSTEW
jgi:hypothetical protein